MNRSTKYNFYLPQNTDLIDPSDFDYNFEIIDANLITESQTFTDTQKSNARTNIGAASASDLGSKSSASSVTGDDAFSKINALNNNIIIQQVDNTSIATLASNVSSGVVRRYFISSSSNLSDYPSSMTNYPNYVILTIKKQGAIAYVDIQAVAQNGTPGFVTGYFANGSLFWGNVL